MATSNKNMGMNPFVNRKVQRVDRITKDSTNQQIKKRNAKSEAPSFTNYRKLLDTVYLQNPILSLLFEMQSLTGLRFSDASTLIRSDFMTKTQIGSNHTLISRL